MADLGSISFTRTDFSIPSHIEQFGMDYADHFKVQRNYVPNFCRLIQTSKKWNMTNLQKKLNICVNQFSRIKGTAKIVNLINSSFSSCQNHDEIHYLRGVMVEALIIGLNGGSSILTQSNFGWGARVDLNISNQTEEVIYECNRPISTNCKRRSTIDFGYWSGRHGKFYECKAQPLGIGCKEVSYMKELKTRLIKHSLSHEIFFVCAAPQDEVEIRLERDFGLSPIYHALGYEGLQSIKPAKPA